MGILSSNLKLAGKDPEKDSDRWEWRHSEEMTTNQMSILSFFARTLDYYVDTLNGRRENSFFIIFTK